MKIGGAYFSGIDVSSAEISTNIESHGVGKYGRARELDRME